MVVTPIELSALMNQRSDLSKVGGDDFLKIQQDQLANVIQQEEEKHQYETKSVEMGEDINVDPEQRKKQEQPTEEEEPSDTSNETPPDKDDDSVEYVAYEDPDIGKSLDWQV